MFIYNSLVVHGDSLIVVFQLQRLQNEIIQTNKSPENDIIQTNKLAINEIIQTNKSTIIEIIQTNNLNN